MTIHSLKAALDIISKIIQKNNTLPILGCVLLKDKQIIATELEYLIVVPLPDYEGDPICLNYEQLKNFCKKFKVNQSFDIVIEHDNCHLKNNSFDIIINHFSDEEYVSMPFTDYKYEVIDILHNSNIETVIEAVDYCAKDISRPVLNCVNVTPDSIVSTDAHRLLFRQRKHNTFECKESYLLTKKVIKLFKGLKSIKINKDIPQGDNYSKYLKLESDSFVLYQRICEGRYPDYKSVIPNKEALFVELQYNTKDLLNVCSVSEDVNKSCPKGIFRYDLIGQVVNIRSFDIDLNISSEININFKVLSHNNKLSEYPVLEYGMNLSFLKSYLKHCKNGEVIHRLSGSINYKYNEIIEDDCPKIVYLLDDNGNKIIDSIDFKDYASRCSIFNDEFLLMPMMIKVD